MSERDIDKEFDDAMRDFAKVFIARRNDCLAQGNLHGFVSLYENLYDTMLCKHQNVQLLSPEEQARLRAAFVQAAEDYGLEKMPNA